MDLMERLLGHGRWFNDKFLEAALPLSDDLLDREFDIGHRTFRKTAVELVNVIERETVWLSGVPAADPLPDDAAIRDIRAAHTVAYDKFEAAARDVIAGGAERQTTTYTDNYGIPQSIGGTMLFVITQNIVRQAELRHFLVRLGVEDVLDGDIQVWEHFSGSIDRWGGQYPDGFVRPWES